MCVTLSIWFHMHLSVALLGLHPLLDGVANSLSKQPLEAGTHMQFLPSNFRLMTHFELGPGMPGWQHHKQSILDGKRNTSIFTCKIAETLTEEDGKRVVEGCRPM